MADTDHYVEAADGLLAASKALRACGEEEAAEDDGEKDTPRSEQPKNLGGANREARKQYAKARGEKPRDDSDD